MKIQDIDKSFDFVNTKSVLSLLFSIVVITLCGQVPQPQFEVTDSTVDLSIAIDAVIEDLNLGDVTTNILYDRGWKLGSLDNFDGSTTSDTVRDHAVWLRQYGSLVTAYRGASAASPVPSITTWKAQRNAAVSNGKNPFVMMHIDYQQFLTDSVLLSTLIYENNGKLEDYPNQSTSPFKDMKAFSFSPYLSTVYDSLSLTFETDPLFFKSNYVSTVSTLSVDFDNGSGYQSIGTNGTVKVSWTTFGTKILKLKVAYANGQTFYAKSTLHLIQTANYRPPGAKSNAFEDAIQPIAHPTDPAYTAELQIEYACGHDKLIKPYIFVEGFSPEQFQANKTYADYYDELDKYQGNFSAGYQLLDELFENGYDIVYVDFAQGTGDIIKNAKVLAEAIKWVNDEKAANGSTEPNVVVGYSMGGLIARLGIRYLEIDNIDPDVSYYISWDAPHLGANVPLGIRLAVDDMYNIPYGTEVMGEYEEDLNDAYAVVNSPAALQMLLYSFDDFDWDTQTWDTSTRNYFANELSTKGLPTSTVQNIAIAKGNGIGAEQHFGSLAPLLNMDIQNNFDCFANLVDIYGLVEFDEDNGIGEQAVNQFIGSLIKALTFIGVRADVEMDVNAMPGYVPESYQIYERKIQFRILWIIPVGGGHTKVKVGYSYPYDSCPGSTYSVENFSITGGDLEPLLDGTYAPCLELHEQDFCFIPTFSALDIYDYHTAPYTPIDPESVVANNKTSFDKCFLLDSTMYPPNTAPTNESHISFSPSNINPFETYISSEINTINDYPIQNAFTFNFGYAEVNNDIIETNDRITASVSIGGTGVEHGGLWVNRNDRIGLTVNTNNPQSTSNHFSVELTHDCNDHYGSITINPYGEMVIGENPAKTADVVVRDNTWIQMNDGLIEVRPGSKLIIESGGELRLNGGVLRIQNGGEVIVKAGGKLVYEAGASIELNGTNAVLALGGLTRVGDNATFTFTWQGSESGYIRLLEEGYWGERFSVGQNSRIELAGSGKNDLILHLEDGAELWEFQGAVPDEALPSNKWEYVGLTDGKIVMENGSRIVLLAKTDLNNVRVEALNGTENPDGIVNFTLCFITKSSFYNVNIESLLYYWEEAPLFLTDSYFDHCSIHVRGHGMRLLNSHFYKSYVTADNSTINNTVNGCLFEDSRLVDSSPTNLFVMHSEFYDGWYGMAKFMGRATVKCSRFERNYTAMLVGELAEMNLSTLYNGGYNYFADNDYNIELVMAGNLLLKEGFNTIYDANYMNIFGSLDAPAPPCPDIVAARNKWTPHSGSQQGYPNWPDFNEFDVYVPNTCSVNFDFSYTALTTKCGYYDETLPGDHPGKSNPEASAFPIITTPLYFDSIPYDVAVREIAAKTTVIDSVNGDDLVAADMYYELLNLVEIDTLISDSIAYVIEQMRWGCLGNYKTTIERLFANSILTKQENSSVFDPTVQNYVSVLMDFTDSIKTEANYRNQFRLEFMKSTLFRTLGKKQQALQILTNMNYCDHDSLKKRILESQIQNLSFDLLAETYGPSMFLKDSVTFELDSSIYQIPFESFIDSSGFGSYIQSPSSILYSTCMPAFAQKSIGGGKSPKSNFNVFPNPTQTVLHVEMVEYSKKSDDKHYTFRLFDFTGKVVFARELTGAYSKMHLPKLPSALYFYQIESGGTMVEQGKISILY